MFIPRAPGTRRTFLVAGFITIAWLLTAVAWWSAKALPPGSLLGWLTNGASAPSGSSQYRIGGSAEVLYSYPKDAETISVSRGGDATLGLKVPTPASYLSSQIVATYSSRGPDGLLGMGWELGPPSFVLNFDDNTDALSTTPEENIISTGGKRYIAHRWKANPGGEVVCEEPPSGATRWQDYWCFFNPRNAVRITVDGPSYETKFEVRDPHEGTIQTFGATDASRIKNGHGRVVAALLEKEQNQWGKEIKHLYEERAGTNERLRVAIVFDGNKVIHFKYKTRDTNVTSNFRLNVERKLGHLLEEIRLYDGCSPTQYVTSSEIYTDVDTACSKATLIEKVKLTYKDITERHTARYVLASWQHTSGDETVKYRAVEFDYKGDTEPARGDLYTASGTPTTGYALSEVTSDQFKLPDGFTLATNSAYAPFQNYMDQNRDGLADWIHTKNSDDAYWPDPESGNHRLHVRTRNAEGGFELNKSYKEPLVNYAVWLYRGDESQQLYLAEDPDPPDNVDSIAWECNYGYDGSGYGCGAMTSADVESYAATYGWTSANIGIDTAPFIYSEYENEDGDDQTSVPIFESLSMTVECDKLGDTICRKIKSAYRCVFQDDCDEGSKDLGTGEVNDLGSEQGFSTVEDDPYEHWGIKLTDLADYNGDGYLDRVVSGLIVLWDPTATDVGSDGLRHPGKTSADPCIYVSLFDPEKDRFNKFERYSIASPGSDFANLNSAFLSALSVEYTYNSDPAPGDMSNQAAASAGVTASGLFLGSIGVATSFPAPNASFSSYAGAGLEIGGLVLSAVNFIAHQSGAPPETTEMLSNMGTAVGLANSAINTTSNIIRLASSTSGVTLQAVSGWAQVSSAIVAVVGMAVTGIVTDVAQKKMDGGGYNNAVVAANLKTTTAVISIVTSAVSLAVSVIAIAASGWAAGPVVGIITAIVAVVYAVIVLSSSEGSFEYSEGDVKWDVYSSRGIRYRNDSDEGYHQARTNQVLNWMDITGDGRLDLVVSGYSFGTKAFAVAPAHTEKGATSLSTQEWRSWSFHGGYAQNSLASTATSIQYKLNHIHRADQTDGTVGFADINGDGLADLVDTSGGSPAAYGPWVFLNNGHGFESGREWEVDGGASSAPELCTTNVRLSRSRSLSWTEFVDEKQGYSVSLSNVTQVLGIDVDQNGLPDLVVRDESSLDWMNEGGDCNVNYNSRVCDTAMPVITEPYPSSDSSQACRGSDRSSDVWFANFDGSASEKEDEGATKLTKSARDIYSPRTEAIHYVAFNTGNGFTKYVKLTTAIPSLGGGLSVVETKSSSKIVPDFAMSGTSNFLADPDGRGQLDLIALDINDTDIKKLSGSSAHPVHKQYRFGIQNPDALVQVKYPEGGVAGLDYEVKRDVGGEQGPPIWVLSKATFDDLVSSEFRGTAPYVEYHYTGGKLKDREFYGFQAIGEERWSGTDLTQVIQVFDQSGLDRTSVTCTEVRGSTVYDGDKLPGGGSANVSCGGGTSRPPETTEENDSSTDTTVEIIPDDSTTTTVEEPDVPGDDFDTPTVSTSGSGTVTVNTGSVSGSVTTGDLSGGSFDPSISGNGTSFGGTALGTGSLGTGTSASGSSGSSGGIGTGFSGSSAAKDTSVSGKLANTGGGVLGSGGNSPASLAGTLTDDMASVTSCYSKIDELGFASIYALQKQVRSHYSTVDSVERTLADGTTDDVLRNVDVKMQRTRIYNGSGKSVESTVTLEFAAPPYKTPTSSVMATSDGLARSVVTTWDHHDAEWLFLKRTEKKLDGSGNLFVQTEFDYEASSPYALREVRQSDGSETRTRTYDSYNTAGLPTSITEAGLTTRYQYYGDSDPGTGKLRSVRHSADVFQPLTGTEEFTYDVMGRVLTHRDASGQTARYTYDALGVLSGDALPGVNPRTYAHHDVGSPTYGRSKADLGNAQRIVRTDTIDGETIATVTYQDGFNRKHRDGSSAEGTRTVGIDFDGDGVVDKSVTFSNDQDWFTHYGASQVIRDTKLNARGQIQCTSTPYIDGTSPTAWDTTLYDPLMRTSYYSDYMGFENWTVYAVNSARKQSEYRVDELGASLTVKLDGLGRRTSEDRSGLLAYRYEYNDYDGLVRTTNKRGFVTIRELNGWNQPLKACGQVEGSAPSANVCPADWPTMSFEYDTYGQPTSVTDPNGYVTTVEYSNCRQPGLLTYPTDSGLAPHRKYTFDEGCRVSEVRERDGTITEYSYNAMGLLASTTRAAGTVDEVTLANGYDAIGRPLYAEDGRGIRSYALVDFRNLTVSSYAPLGREYQNRYDIAGNKVSTTDPEGFTRSAVFDTMGRMLEESWTGDVCNVGSLNARSFATLSYGHRVVYTRDIKGRATGTLDAAGSYTEVTYDLLDRVVRRYATDLTNPAVVDTSAYTETTYDEAGQVKEVRDAGGHTTTFFYDGLGRRTMVAAPLNSSHTVRTRYEYDSAGNVLRVETPTAFPGSSSCSTSTTPDAHWIEYTYTPMNEVETVTDRADQWGSRHVETREYDRAGRLSKVTDGRSNETRFDHDNLGRVTTITAADGTVREFEYDENGNVTKAVDERSLVTRFAYDELNQQVSVVPPTGTRLYREYNRRGDVVLEAVLADLATNRWEGSRYTYTSHGLRATASQATYTGAAPTLASFTDLSTSRSCYDGAARALGSQDENGRIRQVRYDTRGRKSQELLTPIGAGPWETATFAYDNDNLLTSVTVPMGGATGPASLTTTYGYDWLHRRISETYPQALDQRAWYYNDAGGVCRIADLNGGTLDRDVKRTLDPRGLVTREAGVGFTHEYEWDEVGNRTYAKDPSGYWEYEYDSRNRLAAQVQSVRRLGLSFTTAFSYTPTGVLETITYPVVPGFVKGPRVEVFTPDSATNRVTAVSTNLGAVAQGIRYDGMERPLFFRMGNGAEYTASYDNWGRLATEQLVFGAGKQNDVSYRYDSVGNLLQLTDNLDGKFTFEYNYDERNRLTSMFSDSMGGWWRYGLNSQDLVDSVTAPTAALNKVLTYNGFGNLDKVIEGASTYSYTFDRFGNRDTTTKGNFKFSFDGLNRITKVADASSSEASVYGFDTRRVEEGSKVYLYEAGMKPLVELQVDASKRVTSATYNVYFQGRLAQSIDGKTGSTLYFDNNRQGSPTLTMKATPGGYERRAYGPWGEILPRPMGSTASMKTSFGFQGALANNKTGLNLMHHRHYDPFTYSWVQSDPLGLSAGASRYGFVNANPTSATDPLGLDEIPDGASVATGDSGLEAADPSQVSSSMANASVFAVVAVPNEDMTRLAWGTSKEYIDSMASQYGFEVLEYFTGNVDSGQATSVPTALPSRSAPPPDRLYCSVCVGTHSLENNALNRSLLVVMGVTYSVVNGLLVEPAKMLWDLWGNGLSAWGAVTGLWDYEHTNQSGLGKAAEKGASTGDLFVGMVEGILETPGRALDGLMNVGRDPFETGRSLMDFAQLVDGAVGAGKALTGGARALTRGASDAPVADMSTVPVPETAVYSDPEMPAWKGEQARVSSGQIKQQLQLDDLQPGALAGKSSLQMSGHGAPGILSTAKSMLGVRGSTAGGLLKAAGFDGDVIVLTSCNGGTRALGVGPSFAQDLANATGARVLAVDGGLGAGLTMGAGKSGKVVVWSSGAVTPLGGSTWRSYSPGGSSFNPALGATVGSMVQGTAGAVTTAVRIGAQ